LYYQRSEFFSLPIYIQNFKTSTEVTSRIVVCEANEKIPNMIRRMMGVKQGEQCFLVNPGSGPQDDNQQDEKHKYESSSAHSAITSTRTTASTYTTNWVTCVRSNTYTTNWVTCVRSSTYTTNWVTCVRSNTYTTNWETCVRSNTNTTNWVTCVRSSTYTTNRITHRITTCFYCDSLSPS
jgi:hypothetical protein